jgi:hypothetical protein
VNKCCYGIFGSDSNPNYQHSVNYMSILQFPTLSLTTFEVSATTCCNTDSESNHIQQEEWVYLLDIHKLI